ncbi:MAG: Fe-S protein assembly co-chaperone HscB [Gammaproteobacteria bacterium]
MLDFSKNFFELFGLPENYIVDIGDLTERYRDLQRVVHPDRFASSSDQERRISLQASTLINEAFQTLKDPMLRARYMLALHGVELDADAKSTQDMGFLMQQMELREVMAEAKDRPDPLAVIADILEGIDRSMQELGGQLIANFELATPKHLEQAKDIVLKMQFLQKLQLDAESLEAELEDAL